MGKGGKFSYFFCYSEQRGVVHRFEEMTFDDLLILNCSLVLRWKTRGVDTDKVCVSIL